MVNITTYLVKPFFLHGQSLPFQPKDATEWLRVVINRLYNTNKGRLKRAGVNTELLHNHDEITGKTRTIYPLIIYHYFDNRFYVSGINEGIETLTKLFEPVDRTLEIDKNFLLKFDIVKEDKLEIKTSDVEYCYRLTDWLPLNSEPYKRYQSRSMLEKIGFLETQLQKNITVDFGKFLEVDLSETKVTILSIDNLKRSSLPYKGHDYQPFSLDFKANVELPDFMTLGNGKAFGFGRINRIPAKK